ncbi:MAG: exo-beta-N-acetylmuramidase NamZ domain-containing protein [Muribaculaceae bacterium]
MMKHLKWAIAAIAIVLTAGVLHAKSAEVMVGAERTDTYVPLLKGKRIALLSNMTGMVGNKHTLDLMLENGLNVTTIFSPEHGFRGTADAGEKVSSSVDPKTGIPIASLYEGKTHRPSAETMSKFDIIVVDIQDVGLRFYTYYITMVNLMEAAAQHDKEFMVLDRPNPNGMYVDGPMLNMKYRSGVGRLPIPAVHGLTMGEIAMMANGEHWLDDNLTVKHLVVVRCLNYTHQTRYRLPIAPSPNLPNMKSVYLYPSTCLFEGTAASLGRGTKKPFQVYGHPAMKGTAHRFSFTPQSVPGAKNPPLLGKKCYGSDLSKLSDEEIIAKGMNLEYVIDAYRSCGLGDKFFTSFFEKLTGDASVRKMIEDGKSADEIKATWQPELEQFKQLRRRYLIYDE